MKSESINLNVAYKRSLEKACTRKEEPCKEKHIRNIIINTFNDESHIIFFVIFNNFTKINHAIIRFKSYIILHSVLRSGKAHKMLIQYVNRSLESMPQISNLHLVYTELCQFYHEMMVKKVKYLERMFFLRPDCRLFNSDEGIPFNSAEAGIQFIKDTVVQFKFHYRIANQIHSNVKYKGAFPSALPENQCQLRAVTLLLKDMEAIFDLIVQAMVKVSKISSVEESNEINKEFFQPVFSRYNDFLEEMKSFPYITELYFLPQLPEYYSFVTNKTNNTEMSTKSSNTSKPGGAHEELIDFINFNNSSSQLTHDYDSHIPDRIYNQTSPFETGGSDIDLFGLSNPIDDASQCYSNESVARVDEIVTKLEGKINELSEKLHRTELNHRTETEEKISDLMKTNYDLRTRLDELKPRASERDEYASKFSKMRDLYVELRQRYKSLVEKEPGVTDSIISNDSNKEEIVSLKNELSTKNQQIKTFEQNVTDLKTKVSQLTLQTQENTETAKFKHYVEEHATNSRKFFEQIELSGDQPKAALMSVVENAINRLNYVGFQVLGEKNHDKSCAILVAAADQYIPHIISQGKQYMDQYYDSALEIELRKLKNAYLKTLDDITQNEDNVSIDDVIAKISNVANSIMNIVKNLPDVNVVEKNLDELNFDIQIEETTRMVNVTQDNLVAAKKLLSPDEAEEQTLETGVLDGCCAMLEHVKLLVNTSRTLQQEILKSYKKESPKDIKDFYAKNTEWTAGIFGFARKIAPKVDELVLTMRGFVNGDVMVEEMTVAANNVIALLPRLVLVCKQKANPDSKTLTQLREHSKNLRETIKQEVELAKSRVDKVNIDEVDLTNISRVKLMALERQCQIRAVELEIELEKERVKLGKLRASAYRE